jgi:N-acetyl-anhydromuramyl-L-alanine amidase AmpD
MNITKKNSPNKYDGRKGWKPDMIVCHITEGAYAGAVSWLCNPDAQASAHFVVAQDGRVSQLVELTDGSWCNGTSTDAASKVFYGKSSLAAVRERKTNANYYTVSIEHEGVWANAHGKLPDAQLAATIELIKHIRSEVKRIYGVDIPLDREHIVGHYQVDPITKPNCPGANFQFDEIIATLKGTVVTPSQPSSNTGSFSV